MPQFNALHLAIDLACAQRDQAMAELQKRRQAHAFALDQMDQLQQYSTETEQRWMHGGQKSFSPALLHHHYQFMGRLQQAVSLQQGVLGNSGARVEYAQQQVLQAEFRLSSLKQVLAKRQAALVVTAQRRDQKQMDEFASMQSLRVARQKMENMNEY